MTTIAGFAAVFGSLSENLGGPYPFRERIRYGAFREALADAARSDVRALLNHDANFLLGRTASGTLMLKETVDGLYAEITAPDTQTIRDLVLAPIERRDLTAWSFGFTIAEGGERWTQEDGQDIRELTRIGRIMDVALVVYPAYPGTAGITVRGAQPRHAVTKSGNRSAGGTILTRTRAMTTADLSRALLTRQRKFLASITTR